MKKNKKSFNAIGKTYGFTIHKKIFSTTAVRSDNHSLILVVSDPATVAGVSVALGLAWFTTILFLSAATIVMTYNLLPDLHGIDEVGRVTANTIGLSRIYQEDSYDYTNYLDHLYKYLSFYNVMVSESFRNVAFGIEVDEIRRLTASELNGLNLNLHNLQNNTNEIAFYYQRILGVFPDWYPNHRRMLHVLLSSELNELSGELGQLIQDLRIEMHRR